MIKCKKQVCEQGSCSIDFIRVFGALDEITRLRVSIQVIKIIIYRCITSCMHDIIELKHL